MTKRLLLVFAIAGLAMASAKTYRIELSQRAVLGSMQLDPGTYNVDVDNDKAIFRLGKHDAPVGEVPVKLETAATKYATTSVRLNNDGGKMTLQEIHIGKTTTKLVFTD